LQRQEGVSTKKGTKQTAMRNLAMDGSLTNSCGKYN
jgi:hypothetical protein